MKNKLVVVPTIKEPITHSPGFAKKLLSDFKLDISGLCGFGCAYCSSNAGNYLRINRERFADATEEQLGERTYPTNDPALMFLWPDVVERMEQQLHGKRSDWGRGKTLVFSMLTDGFAPRLVSDGTTREALQLLVDRTGFRVRVLTKNAIVGSRSWVSFFEQHKERFVVGVSTGTLDGTWSKNTEIGTSTPSARLRALGALQEAGVPTYGMLCPVFPDVLTGKQLEDLVDAINPRVVEHVWAEPYNDRHNWRKVQSGYEQGTDAYNWFARAFQGGDRREWSAYATELYKRLRAKAKREGWLHKLRYLLYEGDIASDDVRAYGNLEGVILQSKTDESGRSQHPQFAALHPAGRVTDRCQDQAKKQST